MTTQRLIEAAFPLKQTSINSVHEKSVRHGHISTLHIWPARRPLAASRAALIATLLSDPEAPEDRGALLERIGGRVVEKVETKRENGRIVERRKEETVGGILHWGRENSPDLDWFREEIRKEYGGRPPRVLDPFAGGGAIPLEAMRLGCEVTAMDINPVAWFILKCTLEYPQMLAGQTRPLPAFAREDHEFMETFLKAKGYKGVALRTLLERVDHAGDTQLDLVDSGKPLLEADLAWHIRAWGRWVSAQVRKDLASFYPTYAEFQSLSVDAEYERHPIRLLDLDEDGNPQLEPLNSGFDDSYLKNPANPRWVAKPTVAYLWARTVTCKQCRAILPLLKTRWLCKKPNKRVLLTMEPDSDESGFVFGVQPDAPVVGGNAAQRREHDRRIGGGTMSRTGATCPCCGVIMTMQDIRLEGRTGRLGAVMTAVVVNGPKGKEYRVPTDHEREIAAVPEERLNDLYRDIPFGLPDEPLPSKEALGFRVPLYGFDTWRKLFTNRQLLALGAFVLSNRGLMKVLEDYPDVWREAIIANLAIVTDRLADYSSTICSWHGGREVIAHTFTRFALPIVWDYTEVNPFSDSSGNFLGALDWVSRFVTHAVGAAAAAEKVDLLSASAIGVSGEYDIIVTDPPYYDAIPYADLMDFFYVWLRRSTHGLSPDIDAAFKERLSPKWDHDISDGELIDDASRFGGDKELSKKNYEDGMARAFRACHSSLRPDGRLVVAFANKQPDAWEVLVSAIIRAGLVVDGSWPIATEMQGGVRIVGRASLASSVWIVCKKRPPARPGWDTTVLSEMRENITRQLREFWDAGIRGPDFVWAATGPALEAFSKHPVVKKANAPNEVMSVSEFLREVRRMVVDFVVGRVLSNDGEEAVTGLDDVTTYYLLHRNDFGMNAAPVGGCILYALSCNISDSALVNQHDLLAQPGKTRAAADVDESDETDEADDSGGSGSKLKLKAWNQRHGRNLGLEAPGGQPLPLIDQVHKLMQLWRAGDQVKVNNYLDTRGLQSNSLFSQILQALIELAEAGSDERSILEAISNHIAARGDIGTPRQRQLQFAAAEDGSC